MSLENKIHFSGTVCGCLYSPEPSLTCPYGKISFRLKEQDNSPEMYALVDQVKPPILNGNYVVGEAIQVSISTPKKTGKMNIVTQMSLRKIKGGEEIAFFLNEKPFD